MRIRTCTLQLLAAVALAASSCAFANDGDVTFSPASGVVATLLVRGQQVELTLQGLHGDSRQVIGVETERPLRIDVEDYNFDGHRDFAISRLDDGMGTYRIHQVYVYAASEGRFVALAPKCGDEFINLRVDKRNRALINSYVEEQRYRTCVMKF